MTRSSASRCPVRKVRIGAPRRGRALDEPYLAWIRTQPCICCGTHRYIEAAHVGFRGLGQKCADREALPLCSAHHVQGAESQHVLGRGFFEHWKLDRTALIAAFQRQYETKTQTTKGTDTNMALKLNLNEPVQLALLRADAKVYQHEGKAPSHMYSVILPDGTESKVFLTPAASQAILELRIQPREWFNLCRRKTPQGVEFYDLQTSANAVARTLNPVPVPPPQPPIPTQPQATLPEPLPMPPQRALTSGQTRASSVMGAALIAAIDAATLAQQYAAAKGIEMEFGSEDVRCIAATIFIAASKEAALAA